MKDLSHERKDDNWCVGSFGVDVTFILCMFDSQKLNQNGQVMHSYATLNHAMLCLKNFLRLFKDRCLATGQNCWDELLMEAVLQPLVETISFNPFCVGYVAPSKSDVLHDLW